MLLDQYGNPIVKPETAGKKKLEPNKWKKKPHESEGRSVCSMCRSGEIQIACDVCTFLDRDPSDVDVSSEKESTKGEPYEPTRHGPFKDPAREPGGGLM